MPQFLHNAIAYRHDFHARETWSGARTETIPVSCPNGCAVEYDLLVSEHASGEDALKWVEALLDHMESQHPAHANFIIL